MYWTQCHVQLSADEIHYSSTISHVKCVNNVKEVEIFTFDEAIYLSQILFSVSKCKNSILFVGYNIVLGFVNMNTV